MFFTGVLAITIISVNYFTHTSWYLWRWGSSQDYYAPCHGIEAIPIWQLKMPKLGSESNIRLVNITKDQHLDVIMGFGTGTYTIMQKFMNSASCFTYLCTYLILVNF